MLAADEPDEEAEALQQVGDYRETSLGIDRLKCGRDNDHRLPLTNFGATIISDVTLDDGVEPTRAFEIKATLKGRVATFMVNSVQFNQMNWALEHLGAEAVVQPGQGTKDRARVAIQSLSKEIRAEAHLYPHWAGARSATTGSTCTLAVRSVQSGPVEGFDVRLPEALQRYELEIDENLREAVQASLAIRKVAPDKITIPLIGCTDRAVIGKATFSLLLEGFTGVHKTGLVALPQQHFGAAMDEGSLPRLMDIHRQRARDDGLGGERRGPRR